MRDEPTILHVDLDAFFAAVEQRDKPSLRGKPVVVGGVGGRGVVATASYEARAFGVRSAMSTRQARAQCPHAAYLRGRFEAYRRTSAAVMAELRGMSPLVEPLSLDEAYVDLAAGGLDVHDAASARAVGLALKERVREVTGGLAGSVGIGTSKLVAKIASDLDKPDGLVVVAAGDERALLDPLPVTAIPGVGPATAERLRRVGVVTVAQLAAVAEDELVRLVGSAQGRSLHRLARADDDRPVVAEREAKSVSAEDTYDTDLVDRRVLEGLVTRQAHKVAERLRKARLAGRTITLKVRSHDFTTHTRSSTLVSPTDRPDVIARTARTLLGEADTVDGVRLLGVGVSGLTDWVQEDLFAEDDQEGHTPGDGTGDGTADGTAQPDQAEQADQPGQPGQPDAAWQPGMDVVHSVHGRGWVWGAGVGRVTVRFETADTPPGPVRTFRADDPDLAAAAPLWGAAADDVSEPRPA